jgi:hypothetical protein
LPSLDNNFTSKAIAILSLKRLVKFTVFSNLFVRFRQGSLLYNLNKVSGILDRVKEKRLMKLEWYNCCERFSIGSIAIGASALAENSNLA